MSTTPLWVPLVIAGLGVFGSIGGTIVGVVVTQRRSDRREELQWVRAREMEREQWAREDALRTFEQRRICYIEFEEHLRSTALTVYNTRYDREALDLDWQSSAYQSLLRLQIFATPEAAEAANSAYNSLCQWSDVYSSDGRDHLHSRELAYDKAHAQYLSVIRHDLKVQSETAE